MDGFMYACMTGKEREKIKYIKGYVMFAFFNSAD